MHIKYIGPKPLISHTGITFDRNKEDKFVYLNIAVQFIKAIDHEYYEDRKYIYNMSSPRLSNDQLEDEIKKCCKNYQQLVDHQEHCIEDEVHEELERARENLTLNSIEREVLENNIRIMHDYLIQRSINKAVYYCVIERLAELVKKDNLDYIVAPMFETFVHVLHSVEGVLAEQKFPIDTNLEIFEENSQLFVKLDIINH
ncbi:hypothetical protein [Sulfurimonas marina]|uniref:Uncharacterized protein n=1 Tax=Sulfurimonas marina TaxID=2590551 RepID=A0A7M1AX99_9BACT|nr:hypothetical protein [Sulfurimonas marina]QOP42079.1 hypothetical protein FJR03_10155 [Sulfurimonas marina]